MDEASHSSGLLGQVQSLLAKRQLLKRSHVNKRGQRGRESLPSALSASPLGRARRRRRGIGHHHLRTRRPSPRRLGR